ncbi:hypothetical protein N9L14_03325 [Alphaproteobacteria bacterium]|nr:hypothetical protein [Alphaproteobacteria bacterium]
MSISTSFDAVIEEMKNISRLNQSGYDFKLQCFSVNGCKRAEEWQSQIDTISAILKNSAPSDTLKIFAVKG